MSSNMDNNENVLRRNAKQGEAHRQARAADADRQRAENKYPKDRADSEPGAVADQGFTHLGQGKA